MLDFDVVAVSTFFKVPPFYAQESELWFSQLETSFEVEMIAADKVKYNQVIANIEPQFAMEVRDIIGEPLQTDRYRKLKSELVRCLSSSQEQKTHELLKHEILASRKTSQLFQGLPGLTGWHVPENLVHSF